MDTIYHFLRDFFSIKKATTSRVAQGDTPPYLLFPPKIYSPPIPLPSLSYSSPILLLFFSILLLTLSPPLPLSYPVPLPSLNPISLLPPPSLLSLCYPPPVHLLCLWLLLSLASEVLDSSSHARAVAAEIRILLCIVRVVHHLVARIATAYNI